MSTNSLDGDHAMLQRWYADHAHLLMRFDGLQEARLFQRSDVRQGLTAATPACHYLCFYTFASAEAFAAFEGSEVRSSAPVLGNPGWMKTGIHIAKRQQYRRITARTQGVPATPADAVLQLRSFRLTAQDWPPIERWLQGGIHQALQQDGVTEVQLYRCTAAPEGQADYVSLVRTRVGAPAIDLCALGQTDAYGSPPEDAEALWQAHYQSVGHWIR